MQRVPLGHKARGRQYVRGRRPTEIRGRLVPRSGAGTQKSVSGVFATTSPGRLPTNSGGAGVRRFFGGSGSTAGGAQPFSGFFRSPFFVTATPPAAEAPRPAPVFDAAAMQPATMTRPRMGSGKKKAMMQRKKLKL